MHAVIITIHYDHSIDHKILLFSTLELAKSYLEKLEKNSRYRTQIKEIFPDKENSSIYIGDELLF